MLRLLPCPQAWDKRFPFFEGDVEGVEVINGDYFVYVLEPDAA